MSYLATMYERLRLLRRTERGEVWLAADRAGRPVIVKRARLTGLPYSRLMEMKCPICPRIFYCAEDGGETVVVEEYVNGEPLSERLARGEFLGEDEAEGIMLQVADGLRPIHEAGIIHRDIKPAHLLLDGSGTVRLIDFDASRIVKEGRDEDTTRLGTRGYAPPEQFGYGQTDARSDIYSLGVTIGELLGPAYRGRLSPILEKCTQVDMAKRYASVSELREALHQMGGASLLIDRDALGRAAWRAALVLALVAALYGAWWHGREASVVMDAKPDRGIQAEEDAAEEPKNASEPPGRRAAPPAGAVSSKPPDSPAQQAATAPEPAPAPQKSAQDAPGSDASQGTPTRDDQPDEAVNYIRAQIFVNGKHSNAWMEKWDMDIVNGGTSLSIPRRVWEAWREEQNHAPEGTLRMPEEWNARIHLANRTSQPWENPWIELHYTNQGRDESSVMRGSTLAPGESMDFHIPLGGYSIDYPDRDTNTSAELKIDIHGDGPQELYCSSFSIDFVCKSE